MIRLLLNDPERGPAHASIRDRLDRRGGAYLPMAFTAGKRITPLCLLRKQTPYGVSDIACLPAPKRNATYEDMITKFFSTSSHFIQKNTGWYYTAPGLICAATPPKNVGGFMMTYLTPLLVACVEEYYVEYMRGCMRSNVNFDPNYLKMYIKKDFDTPKGGHKSLRSQYKKYFRPFLAEHPSIEIRHNFSLESLFGKKRVPIFTSTEDYHVQARQVGREILNKERQRLGLHYEGASTGRNPTVHQESATLSSTTSSLL